LARMAADTDADVIVMAGVHFMAETAKIVNEDKTVLIPDLAAGIYPMFPVRRLARIRYESAARLARARCPVLIVHSRDDEIVPFAQGESVFRAAAEPKHFLALGGGHNTGFLEAGEVYSRTLDHFLTETANLPRTVSRK